MGNGNIGMPFAGKAKRQPLESNFTWSRPTRHKHSKLGVKPLNVQGGKPDKAWQRL